MFHSPDELIKHDMTFACLGIYDDLSDAFVLRTAHMFGSHGRFQSFSHFSLSADIGKHILSS